MAVLDPRPVFLPFEFEHLPLAPGNINVALGTVVAKALDGKNLEGCPRKCGSFTRCFLKNTGRRRELMTSWPAWANDWPPPNGRSWSAAPTWSGSPPRPWPRTWPWLLREAGVNAGLFYLLPGANAFGAALLSPPDTGLTPLVEALEAGAIKALLVVESDPFWDYPDRERLTRALEKLELLVVLDYLPSPTVAAGRYRLAHPHRI